MSAELQVSGYSVATVREQVNAIQVLMSEVMQDGQHYGTIQGMGNKPTLFKAGAEKLAFMFRLAPSFKVIEKELPNNHREFRTRCILTHIDSGNFVGSGEGICSTMESKYRYRWMKTETNPLKEEADELKAKGLGKWSKQNDNWIFLYKQDNPDIADQYNTVLKMAEKRAFVSAILKATAASDIFTQDIEDMKPETKQEA